MSAIDPCISTYTRFASEVLPQVKELGYNAIQVSLLWFFIYLNLNSDNEPNTK
jgi:hypothetical protein